MLWSLTLLLILRISASSPSVFSVKTEKTRFSNKGYLLRLSDTSFFYFPYYSIPSYTSSGQVQVQMKGYYYSVNYRRQCSQSGQGKLSQSLMTQSNVGLSINGSAERTGKKFKQSKEKNYPQSRQERIEPVSNIPINSERPIPGSQINGTKVKEKTIVKKCCPLGQGYDIRKKTCVVSSDSFNPPVWDGYNLTKEISATQAFKLNISDPICLPSPFEKLMQATHISQELYVTQDGHLTMEFPKDRSPAQLINPQKYCMDSFVMNENQTKFDAFVCYMHPSNLTHMVFTCACMLVTCFLMLLRMIMFAWLKELRTIHDMILMAYLISFLLGYTLLAISQLLFILDIIVQDICTFISIIVYFLLFSAYFWRNVMCYDIWCTFSGKRALSTRGYSSWTCFSLYSVYAFGASIALTAFLAVLIFSGLPNTHPFKPKMTGCFMFGYSRMIYFYGPIMSLFIINVIFSTLTALKIAAIKKETNNVLRSNSSSIHDQRRNIRRFSLYVKLFAAMSFSEVNWILDVIALFVPEVKTVLHAADIYNMVAPLTIFIYSIGQKHTWKKIKQRLREQHRTTQSLYATEIQVKQV